MTFPTKSIECHLVNAHYQIGLMQKNQKKHMQPDQRYTMFFGPGAGAQKTIKHYSLLIINCFIEL